jgi:hypothetical protein
MKTTPRYLVQLSSAEIGVLHALVQRQVRAFVAERPEGRGLELGTAPPELAALDRRLLAQLMTVTDQEEARFGDPRRARPEAAWIAEEHAALAEAARPRGEGVPRPGRAALMGHDLVPAAGGPGGNVVPLRGAGRHRRARASA